MMFNIFSKKENPNNGFPKERKTREELQLERRIKYDKLIKDAIHEAALILAGEIVSRENKRVIDQGIYTTTIHDKNSREVENEITMLLKGEDNIEITLSRYVFFDVDLLKVLSTIIEERGFIDAKEMGKILLKYRKLGESGAEELGKIFLEDIEKKREIKRKKIIEEEERLAKIKMRIK